MRTAVMATMVALGTVGCGKDPVSEKTTLREATPLVTLGLGEVTDRYTAEVDSRGGIAYTTTWGHRGANAGDLLNVWDVSGNTPVLLTTRTISGAVTTGDVQVSDDGKLLVVATELTGGSIVIFDLTNPTAPTEISRFSSANTYPGVHTAEVARVNGTLYGFLSIDPASSFPARLVVVDLSDPVHPREVLSRVMGEPFVHDVHVRDGILFTALWDAGMSIWDIGGAAKGGTPANPVLLGNVRTVGGDVHNIVWPHDPGTGAKRYAFVGQEGPAALGSAATGDVHVVDVSDFTKPREVAFYHVNGAGTHNFAVDEPRGILYAAFYNGGVRGLDIRGDLGSCTAAQKGDDGVRCDLSKMGRELTQGLAEIDRGVYVWGVRYQNDVLLASDMLNGLWKLRAATR
jgi:hypothetical protein